MRTFGDVAGGDVTLGGRILGYRGAISTEHYLSAQAGMDILSAGGNAFDAAAAAVLVEGVVNPHMFTIGGECPVLAHVADTGATHAVNGNTKAPGAISLDVLRGRGISLLPPRGVISAGVPACLDALLTMLEHWGSMGLAETIAPALMLARHGFPVHEGLVFMPNYGIAHNVERFRDQWPASAKIYLTPGGQALAVGHKLINPDLADLLTSLADEAATAGERIKGIRAARTAFYHGEPARIIADFVKERDGLLAYSDVAAFDTLLEKPLSTEFRNCTVHKCGPWSQGPVFLQMLRLLDTFDMESMGHNSADYLHLWTEAAKLAYADREQYYGDPALVDVPLDGLLSPDYAAARRALIDMKQASLTLRPGDPRKRTALLPDDQVVARGPWGPGTVHVAVADSQGNLAALTPSGGWITGNEIMPGLGFPLTTRVQTFHLREGHPNVPAPFKRPRTTLTPSMAVFRGNGDAPAWKMAFGTMGGDQQDQWLSQFFLNRVVFGMTVQQAIEAPKVTSDHFPSTFHPHDEDHGLLKLEGRIPQEVRDELTRRGHRIFVEGDWAAGYICAATRYENGLLEAGADPRGNTTKVFPSMALAR